MVVILFFMAKNRRTFFGVKSIIKICDYLYKLVCILVLKLYAVLSTRKWYTLDVGKQSTATTT